MPDDACHGACHSILDACHYARAFFFILFFQEKKMEREKPAAFARRIGVHKSTVTRAIQAGRLLLVDGQLDIAVNLARWESTKIGSRPDVAARHEAQRSGDTPNPIPATEKPADAPADRHEALEIPEAPLAQGTLPYYTARRLAAQNSLVRLGMQLRSQQRYPLDGVRREAYALGGTLRASLERMIDQTAPRLCVLKSAEERRALLSVETRQLRRDLQREFVRALRRLRSLHAGPLDTMTSSPSKKS